MTKRLAFQEFQSEKLNLQTRIVMPPMARGFSNEKHVYNDKYTQYYTRRAEKGVGLVISEGTFVSKEAQFTWNGTLNCGVYNDDHMEGLKKICEGVHKNNGKFAVQLWHTGKYADSPICPYEATVGNKQAKVATLEDLKKIKSDFVNGARIAKKAGCDAVEIHGAHEYFLDEFIQKKNLRTDGYGTTFEGKIRFPIEVVKAVREEVGQDFPILYRTSQWTTSDYNETKWDTLEELGKWGNALKDAGVDILHVSTNRAYKLEFEGQGEEGEKHTLAGWYKKLTGLPVIAVGGVCYTQGVGYSFTQDQPTTVEDPEPFLKLIEDGEFDLLAVGRALIKNHDWVELVRTGNWKKVKPFVRSDLMTLN
ncbi:n-ethylmaleimide reductase [Anaeramoeba flamelloides]|uniref:N-ethylmaleimide reductase n=1 Tax=Anaeramoeba flamelloides TaxID=1746091 RepID=A0AAV8A9V3_9EUKA|nr:n-ethylmaleimide reductase [Anaeramoeba flamelloides]KAJ6253629.1 n-ethylmaleimide reductase [Anaeramoeba flamelloides]|eukprot:Anaeramoba_flamelloidesa87987_1401.p1 GENE.a87987_1401~~a87987_1401.p1  ORF type:complete len:364 (-),score=89.77 a87987_1401:277-1368(-)